MSKCTAAQAITEAQYWLGYCEKASANYATSDSKSCFTANAGSNNYTYFGNLWGYQGQAWCALFVTSVIYRAAGQSKTDAKTMLHGVLPYAACNQLYDAAPAAYRGRSKYYGGSWTPQSGDVIIFTQNGQRVHTGFVESATSTTVNTIEGNVGDKVNRKSYSISSSYIWGYVRPLYTSATTGTTTTGSESYGSSVSVTLNELSYGNTGDQVKTLQRILYSYYGSAIKVDGEFGTTTKSYLMKLQKTLGLTADGICGAKSWAAILSKMD